MAQALYRKWRPQTFDDVVGQDHIVRTLRNALTSGRVHHAYLFAGPRGTGKTSSARLLAKAVNCLAEELADRPCNECSICQAVNEGRLLDLIEIDAASNTGVDDVRELRERVGFRPNEARYKVYVIDEVHMLSNAAFNALLKTLEEPPPHAIFVLATTEPHKILATILSRCQRLDFRRIPLMTIADRLSRIAEGESISIDQDAVMLIARQATGSMRDAESLLDQLAAYDQGGITADEVRTALGTGAEEAVVSLIDALATGDMAKGLAIINDAVEQGADPRQFARQVVEHLRALLLTILGSDEMPFHVPDELARAFRAQADSFETHQLTRAVRLFSQAAADAKAAWQPQLPLELAFMEAALPAEGPAQSKGVATPPRGGSSSGSRKPSASTPPAPARSSKAGNPSAAPASPSHPKDDSPAASAAQPSNLTLEGVGNSWADLLRVVRSQNLPLEALLRSGGVVEVEGSTVVIGFAHQFHQSKVEEEANRRMIEDAFEKLLGQAVQVRCTVTAGEAEPDSTAQSAVQPPEEQVEDGLVQAAVERLGARVADLPPERA